MPEAWLRGPIAGVPPLLQPVAHALVQVQEELHVATRDVPDAVLWARPYGVASIGFHLQHLSGVLDRLFAYARGDALSDGQLSALRSEGHDPSGELTVHSLVATFDAQVERALGQLRETADAALLDARGVGRAQLPSTVLGLLFHAAEHTTRHFGQLLVTVKAVTSAPSPDARSATEA